MDVFSLLPGWAWVLLILIVLIVVYGFFNRRWNEEEARERDKEKALENASENGKEKALENTKEGPVSAPSESHVPVPAASLRVPSEPGSPGGELPMNGNDDPSHSDQE